MVPIILPSPPAKEVPPITVAAITSNSNPVPTIPCTLERKDKFNTPAKAAKAPTKAKAAVLMLSTFIPEARAARALPPTALK